MRDRDIRCRLHLTVLAHHRSDPDTLVVEELGLCRGEARIDLAVVNGELHGYEIKSARDSLNRLSRQTRVYNAVCDRLTLVVSERHLSAARRRLGGWWGVTVVVENAGSSGFEELRVAEENPRVRAEAVAELLWREEALSALETRGLARGLRVKPRTALWAALARELPLEELKAEVRARLKARTHWRVD